MAIIHLRVPGSIDTKPGVHLAGAQPNSSHALSGAFPTHPAQVTNSSGAFQSSTTYGHGSVAQRYSILGRNLQRMRSSSSSDSGASSDGSPSMTRSSSAAGSTSEASGRGSVGNLSVAGASSSTSSRFQTQRVTYNGQDYVTTTKPTFPDGSYWLFKVGGTQGNALRGKHLADGSWVATPASKDGLQTIKLDGKEYITTSLPALDDGNYLLYPTSPNGFILANDAMEAQRLPDGQWHIVVHNQNTPASSSGSSSPLASAPASAPGTPP